MARNYEKRYTGLNRFLEAKQKGMCSVFNVHIQIILLQRSKVRNRSPDHHWYNNIDHIISGVHVNYFIDHL